MQWESKEEMGRKQIRAMSRFGETVGSLTPHPAPLPVEGRGRCGVAVLSSVTDNSLWKVRKAIT
jgi:hypothetical protein